MKMVYKLFFTLTHAGTADLRKTKQKINQNANNGINKNTKLIATQVQRINSLTWEY